METVKDDASIIRRAGLKATRQCLLVMKTLKNARRPLSHREILHRLPGLDRVTVYRILHRLAEAGILHRTYSAGPAQLFGISNPEKPDDTHPHFRCTSCDRTMCMKNLSVKLPENIGRGFKVSRKRVLIEGLCPECSNAEGDAK